MPDVKFGKLPARDDPRNFKLTKYAVALPPPPTRRFGYGTIFPDWGMLGNDSVGDCVLAGGDHETMLYLRLSRIGDAVIFSPATAISDYSALTGYDPSDPSTDQGAWVDQAMKYRRTTGLVDVNGKRHKIDAYASIDAGDWDMMLRCVWTFGAVGIGFEVPGSALDQYDAGAIWDDVGDGNIVGGHYVPIVGSMAPAVEASCVTWAARQRFTKSFYARYNDEAWVPLSQEQLRLGGYNVRHIDWATLQADITGL